MQNLWEQTKPLILTVIIVFVIGSRQASAGWLDALNDASQKLQQASQQMEQGSQQIQQGSQSSVSHELTPTTNSIKGTWGNQVTCEGPNTATCQNGMDDIINCMHQSQGYYYRLVADNLEGKLKNGQGLLDQDRKDLQADIDSVKAAIDTDRVVDPDPKNQQRWLKRLTREDQRQINQLNMKYSNEVHDDCDKRFGGMSGR